MPITSERLSSEELSSPAAILQRFNHQGVVTLTMNAPAQFNTLSETMLKALHDALDDIAEDQHVRCVVLAAEGKAFCAGH
ncbi:MAG: enoyl-CoA hydratase/isomerase family protein, partial [Gammaproteobacteria bacterium]|nr:enoyl-CoA hydratase/isomerase family protein [Gammaproteobacteria bacterium]